MELSFILNQQQQQQQREQAQHMTSLQHLQEIIHNNSNSHHHHQMIDESDNDDHIKSTDRHYLNNSTEAVVETLLFTKYGSKNPHGFNLNFNNLNNNNNNNNNNNHNNNHIPKLSVPSKYNIEIDEQDDENSPLNSLTEASAMASSPLSSPRLMSSTPVSPAYSFTSPFSPSSSNTSCCNSPRMCPDQNGASGATTTSSATTTPTITSIVGNKKSADNQVVPKKEVNGLKKPRKSYEVSKKLEILEEKLKHGMPYVVEKYHISRSIISRWLSNIDKYRSFNKKNLKKLHKGPKASFSVEQEQQIIDQINQHKANGELVNGEVIKTIALQLSKQLNNNNFKASSGWLENFKNRHGLKA